MFWRRSCAVTAVFTLGCGPSLGGDDDGSAAGSGDDSGAAEGTADAGGSTGNEGDTMADGADASPTSGDPMFCDAAAGADPLAGAECDTLFYGVDAGLPLITVTIANQTDAPIIVPTHVQPPAVRYFDVAGTMGDRVAYTVLDPCPLEFVTPACAEFTREGVGCNPVGLSPNPSLVIQPGGVFEQGWEPLVAAEVVLPPECNPPGDDTLCVSPVIAQAGDFETTVRAYPLVDCGAACQCEANDFGFCETTGFVEEGEPIQATAAWNGQCASIDVVFE